MQSNSFCVVDITVSDDLGAQGIMVSIVMALT